VPCAGREAELDVLCELGAVAAWPLDARLARLLIGRRAR
jgi:hypothetical protein